MVRLFQPQIAELIHERDRVIDAAAATATKDVFEDRDLEIISQLEVDVDEQIAAVEKALG